MTDAAGASEAEPGAPGQPLEREREERRIRRDDDDGAALPGSAPLPGPAAIPARAAVATPDRVDGDAAAAPGPALGSKRLPDADAVDRQALDDPEVGHHQDADGERRRVRLRVVRPAMDRPDEARRAADAGLELEGAHARAGPDDAHRYRATVRSADRVDRGADVGRVHLDGERPVEVAVVALGDDGHDRVAKEAGREGAGERLDRAVVDPPDGHRAGQENRRLEGPPLVDRDPSGHLAGTVEHGRPGRDPRPGHRLEGHRQDRRHARTGRAAAGRWVGFVAPDRPMPDPHARHVDDRVRRPGRHQPHAQPERAYARTLGRGAGGGVGRHGNSGWSLGRPTGRAASMRPGRHTTPPRAGAVPPGDLAKCSSREHKARCRPLWARPA